MRLSKDHFLNNLKPHSHISFDIGAALFDLALGRSAYSNKCSGAVGYFIGSLTRFFEINIGMLGSILLAFGILALLLFLLFVCICAAGCFGMLGLITPFLGRLLSSSHDKPFDGADPINSECFICMDKIVDEVVATCNHSFCGECLTRYIQTNPNRSINCPACRKEVLVLFRRFEARTPEQQQLKDFVSGYNYKYTREPGMLRAVFQFGNIIRHIPQLFSENGIRFILSDPRLKYVILLAIYTLSPFDILPEAVLGPLGLLDDGIAVAALLRQISTLLYGYMRSQASRN